MSGLYGRKHLARRENALVHHRRCRRAGAYGLGREHCDLCGDRPSTHGQSRRTPGGGSQIRFSEYIRRVGNEQYRHGVGEGVDMKDQYIKPIPVVQPWTEAFWKSTKNHSLMIQKCGGCGSLIFYPRKRCPECWSSELGWQESSGRGAVYTFAIVRDMVEPKFVSDLPYVLAMVELEESIRMMTRIVECDPGAVKIGMDVEVVFE